MKQLPATTMQRETIPAKNGTFLTAITAQNVNNKSLQNTCQCCHWGKTQSVKHLCGQPALNQQQKHAEYTENPPEWSWTKTRNILKKRIWNWTLMIEASWILLSPWAPDSKPSHVFPPHRHPAVWANRPPHPLKPQWQLLPRQYLHVLKLQSEKKKRPWIARGHKRSTCSMTDCRVTVPPTSETSLKTKWPRLCSNLGIWLYLSHQEARIHPGQSATCSSNSLAFNSVYIIV